MLLRMRRLNAGQTPVFRALRTYRPLGVQDRKPSARVLRLHVIQKLQCIRCGMCQPPFGDVAQETTRNCIHQSFVFN